MKRTTVLVLAFAAAIAANRSMAGTLDGGSAGCRVANVGDDLDRVPDCMRVGRHVRVETSISRGTATLHDGIMPSGLAAEDPSPADRGRVRVQGPAPGALWSGFFAR